MDHTVNFSLVGSVGLWDLFVTKNNSLMKIQDTNAATEAVINKTTWPVTTLADIHTGNASELICDCLV